MKKWFMYLLIPCAVLLLLLLVIGATQSQTPDPTDPTISSTGPTDPPTDPTDPPTDPTDPPTDPPTAPPTDPSTDPTQAAVDPLFAEFDALFGNRKSWYSRALLCEYNTPADIDLYELFYDGFKDESDKPTDEEWEALKDNPDVMLELDLTRLPVNKMNEVLTQYFGITLQDVKESGFHGLVYLESTDCYYMTHGDTHLLEDFKTTGLETLSDGTIRMSYETRGVACAAILKPVKDGYQILSNNTVGFPVIAGDPLLKEYEELFASWQSWHRQALICQYDDPLKINLKEFFYNGFADESRTPTDEERKALKDMPGIDLSLPLIRLPVEKMNQVLQDVFVEITVWSPDLDFEGLVYLESTNCYYHTASGWDYVKYLKIIKADLHLEYDRLRIYYTLGDGNTYVVKMNRFGNIIYNKLESSSPIDLDSDNALSELNALFGNVYGWYNRALVCEYATPADINLLELFYNGFDIGKPTNVTDEEWEFLKDYTLEDTNLEVIRLPASKMNKVLTQYFGITLKDVKKSGFERLLYLESTDCYYDMHNDANGIMNFKATAINKQSDGTVRLSYTCDNYDGTYVVTLRPNGGNGYLILSNQKA